MPTIRSYRDSCGVARALDVVGERWALLVVRELLFMPQRFSELRTALPHASSNLLADRLRELENHGVIHRRKLSSTATAHAYELTDRGRQLEPIVLALGNWGIDAPTPPEPTSLSATSALIFLRGNIFHAPTAPPIICRLDLNGSVWTVRVNSGKVDVQTGEPTTADISLRTDPKTLGTLMANPAALDTALADGTVALVGDPLTLSRLLYGDKHE
ncbi:HxlR family transcriptional regulator [Nocardia sp. SYP-A9097]|uniref:winged helix-turn-helix transcriptional regulator n=1 Tax=Nocardia sp. SYP-A9097 TaxID=2663237 RepID=UPI00129BA7D1|nr:winged helix-turn-helix transcriptional regulator [Nocardia sp. SYP-A9097]MRH90582.1 HxlR family transcriptional regulator [Nocardia sp. SYP-A9097]